MAFTIQVDPTITGGTATVLTPNGQSAAGKASYTAPGSSRLVPKGVDLLTKAPVPQGQNPGVARGGLRVSVAHREQSEGCCSVQSGTVIIEADARWPLSQPESVIDEAIKLFRAAVLSPEFVNAIKQGSFPV